MSCFKSILVLMLVSASTLVCPRQSQAMEIQMFDDMTTQDQLDYLEFLVKTAQRMLIEQGQKDLAKKVDHLFHAAQSGSRGLTLGEEQFHNNLGDTRSYIARNPNLPFRVNVEFVLMETLVKNGIRPAARFSKDFVEMVRVNPFWPKLPLQRQVPLTPAQPLRQPDASRPTVVCGTTIIPADRAVDPLFLKPAPRGRFTMRALGSTVCQESNRVAVPLVPRLPQFLGPKR